MYNIPEPTTLYELASTYLFKLKSVERASKLGKANEVELRQLFAAGVDLELYEICAEVKDILKERGQDIYY